MAQGKYIAYYRVSTQKQGASGLGLEAQQEAVRRYLNGGEWELVDEFVETETGKGADALAKRPQLRASLEACRKSGARLLIAKLDRLARNVHFITGLMEASRGNGKNAVKFVACDMPDANDLTIHLMAAFAEHEARRISERTKDALAMAKKRGVILGKAGAANLKPNIHMRQANANIFAEKLRGQIEGFTLRKLSQRAMVDELNQLGIRTARGSTWSLVQLQRVIRRLA
ncbi:Site-specific DNA recombinase [Noviherbaspirillum humi]|uniref:Site-specific DNA recombinase n=1 Tax=Noviherbaspirillum humi TaxID=1688639 RepID=A0A239BX62_9BURK|nr:recombinase family protein [Noviherbaspirillum humi]SNS12021.1 Site-specific DNA recombinase [Noviherbaspirillum humi]